jgi:hypothetical protein
MLQKVVVEGRYPQDLVMLDTGANIHMVRTEFTEKNSWKGCPVTQTIMTAGGARTVQHTKEYWVPLRRKEGSPGEDTVEILCLGMPEITDEVGWVDVSAAAEMFDVLPETVYRPKGQVDILIGIHEADLFPEKLDARGSPHLMSSQFGSGLVLAGSHPRIQSSRTKLRLFISLGLSGFL